MDATCPLCGAYTGTVPAVEAHISSKIDPTHRGAVGVQYRDEIKESAGPVEVPDEKPSLSDYPSVPAFTRAYNAWKDAHGDENGSESGSGDETVESPDDVEGALSVETGASTEVVGETCEVFRRRVESG